MRANEQPRIKADPDLMRELRDHAKLINQLLSAGTYDKPLGLGGYFLWVDATGDLRIKSTAPTTDLDGTVVGTQS